MFDFMRGKKPSEGGALAVPQAGVVEQWEPADGVGTLLLADGDRVRFGQSACRGDFVPLPGVPVQVVEVAAHPSGGWRATLVAASAETVEVSDRLLDERARLVKPLAEAVTTAPEHGFLTALLDVEIDSSRSSWRRLLEPVAHALGGEVRLASDAASVTFGDGSADVLLLVGAEAFPAMQADRRFWPEGKELGRCFVTVQHGSAGLDREYRRMTRSTTPDGWEAGGHLRQRLRVVAALLGARGVGVLAHAAGNVAWTKAEWLRRVGDADDLSLRGFTGLVDIGQEGTVLFTQGMDALGLPDVRIDTAALGLSEDEGYERAQAAALFACHTMTFENRILSGAETFAVPLGLELSSGPIERDNAGLSLEVVDTFEVHEGQSSVQLRPTAPLLPVTQHWANVMARGKEFPLPAYRALVEAELQKRQWRRAARLSFGREELPAGSLEHEVWVMAQPDGAFSTLTCGVARRPQHRGTVENDDAHVELLVTLPTHHPRLASFLSYVGRVLQGRGASEAP